MKKSNVKGVVTPMDRLVGRLIHQRRRDVGMSQTTLAKKLGISFQQVQKYENTTNRVTIGRLLEICKALETTVDALLSDLSGKDVKPTSFDMETDSLMGVFRELSTKNRAILISVGRALA